MSNENDKPIKKNIIKHWGWQSIILAGIPILGYMLAYVHEVGFCSEFGIPYEFIILDWTRILIAIGKIIGIAFVLLLYLQVLVVSKPWIKKLGPINARLVKYIAVLFPFIIITIPYRSIWFDMLLVFLIPVSVFVFFDFLYPLIKWKDIKGYRNKLKRDDEFDISKNTLLDSLMERIGLSIVVIIAFIGVLLIASYFNGSDTAQRQEEFFIPSTNQQLVVLRIYGDNLICAPLDREAKEIERNFFILEMSDIALKPEKVGPLTVSSIIQE